MSPWMTMLICAAVGVSNEREREKNHFIRIISV